MIIVAHQTERPTQRNVPRSHAARTRPVASRMQEYTGKTSGLGLRLAIRKGARYAPTRLTIATLARRVPALSAMPSALISASATNATPCGITGGLKYPYPA